MTQPRWIDDPTCDSLVMLAAYVKYHSGLIGTGAVGVGKFDDLYMIVHRPDAAPAPALDLGAGPVPLPTRNCQAPHCLRCREEMGGYQFKWYHPAWEDFYMEHRRLGSWSPR